MPNPNPNPILQFFKSSHLPPALRAVSQPFEELAVRIDANLPASAETSVALRKLLEAKDAAVRARLFKADWSPDGAQTDKPQTDKAPEVKTPDPEPKPKPKPQETKSRLSPKPAGSNATFYERRKWS